MQNTAVQMKTRSAQNTKTQTSETSKSNTDNAQFNDPFLQIIMSLLTQSLDQNTQQDDSACGSLGTNQLSGMAALLRSSPAGMTALINTLLNDGTNAATAMNSANATDSLGLLKTGSVISDATATTTNILPSVYSEQTSQQLDFSELQSLLGKGVGEAGTIAISSDALAQMNDLLGLSGKDELKSLLKNAGIAVSSGESALAKDGLTDAVAKAKQMLSEYLSQQTNDQDDMDVDKLQAQLAKTDTATPFELQLKSASNVSEENVLEQLTDGIKQNISAGKSEFVIKLKPESLGEITVKLVQEAGKTTLTISAANAQTAKLINNDIGALRNAVALMNVDVHNAVVSTNETQSGSMQQFDMSGQQFAGQQFAGQQSLYQMTQTGSRLTDNQTPEDIYASSQATQAKVSSDNRLDAYI